LIEANDEVQRLRDRMSLGTPRVHEDLSLINLVPSWTGSETAVTLEEFLSTIESSARIGRWENAG